ncbi:MAG: hypothetical protein IT416_01755, partial [Candidatus Pacebacteria bacterium]|nr:hypothetical protein [Candidatus Paceibacterota bacterium]
MINIATNQPPTSTTSVPPQQPIMSAPPVQEASAQQPQPPLPSEKKKSNFLLIGGIILAILAIGGLASMFLVQQPQEIRQQATQCQEQCPGNDGVLRNCTPPESDGSSQDSTCNVKGRV